MGRKQTLEHASGGSLPCARRYLIRGYSVAKLPRPRRPGGAVTR
jgi:hypothetical protein